MIMNNIAFPKLGISLNISPVAFSIGSKPIYWYALIILSGFLLGLFFVYKTCEKRGVKKDNVWDIALFGLDSIADMFKVWNGGLAIYGGIIGAIISTVIYCMVKKLNIAKVFDVCAPGLFIGQAIGRFGNFVNVEVYGGETNSLFGMSINGATPVHPLFLYESIWNVIGLVILLLIRDKKKNDGQVFCFYIFWYSFGRLFLEGMRNPNYILYVIPNVLGISQLVAILFMIAAVSAFVVLQVKAKKDNEI